MTRAEEPKVQFKTFEELLTQDGYLVYTNVGSSMLPLLRQRRDPAAYGARSAGDPAGNDERGC